MANIIVAFCLVCWTAAFCNAYLNDGQEIIWFTEGENALHDALERKDADIEERPYMVSMKMKEYDFSTPDSCDAVVVSKKWALTSARCCVKRCGRPYDANLVSLRVASKTSQSGGVTYDVEIIIVKDGYSFSTIQNNLCLLKLKNQFIFGPKLQAVSLAGSEVYDEGIIGAVNGWSKKDGSTSTQLATVTLPLISNAKCQQLLTASGRSNTITERLICVVTSLLNTCHGEKGSPLVVNGYLVGIVSTGYGCANKPGVFTRISEYRDWFATKMDEGDEVEPE